MKKAHKTSKLFNLRGFQVSLSELFHIAFCYFPFRFLPSPYKTPQNQKNKETTKHTKIPSKKYETLILKTFRVDPKRLHERGMCWDLRYAICDMRLVMSLQLGNMCLHVSATFLQKSLGRLFWSCTHPGPGHALVEYSLTALLQKFAKHPRTTFFWKTL